MTSSLSHRIYTLYVWSFNDDNVHRDFSFQSENYDDFCRSVQGKVDRYSSPKKTVGNEPEKSAARQGPIAALATEYRIKDSDAASTGLSPAIEPASDALMSKPAASDQTAEQRQVQTDSVAQNQPSTAPVDTFAERLRARNELKRTLKFAAIARGVSFWTVLCYHQPSGRPFTVFFLPIAINLFFTPFTCNSEAIDREQKVHL